ncbi:MAG TPA: hypothetical protein VKL22_00150 [Actinomycetota bacterium]|nr:hypothetical protein [Actinomycetota bacterium]
MRTRLSRLARSAGTGVRLHRRHPPCHRWHDDVIAGLRSRRFHPGRGQPLTIVIAGIAILDGGGATLHVPVGPGAVVILVGVLSVFVCELRVVEPGPRTGDVAGEG